MKPKDLIMYLVDDILIIYKENIIIEKITNNSFNKGKVSKPQDFLKFLDSIIKKHKLNKGIINNNITVLIDPNYTQADTEILNSILEKLMFNKITFINITKLLEVSKKRVWLIANNKYMFFVYKNFKNKTSHFFIDLEFFKNNINILIKHLLIFIKRKQVIVLGMRDNIDDLASKLETISKSQVYYIDDTFNYYLTKLKIH